ncbi:hypothetical protein [Kitasatospora sp. P5_F3]
MGFNRVDEPCRHPNALGHGLHHPIGPAEVLPADTRTRITAVAPADAETVDVTVTTVPGNNTTQTLSAVHPQVVFAVRCVDHSTPTQPSITITMASGHHTFTGSAWIPSGDQNSALTYQGSTTVPDLCGGTNLDLSAGGTFTTTLN